MSTGNEVLAFCLSLGAGLTTAIGGLLPFFVKVENVKFLAASMGLAAGVMCYVSFIEIFPESTVYFVKHSGHLHANLFTTSSFFGGIFIGAILDFLVHLLDNDHHDQGFGAPPPNDSSQINDGNIQQELSSNLTSPGPSTETLNSVESSALKEALISKKTTVSFLKHPIQWIVNDWKGDDNLKGRQKLKKTGFITALAIAIHNLPEGLATFVATLDDPTVGVSLAVAIAIHNIPEGICVAMPIYYSTGSRLKGFLWALLSGLSEPVGAGIGWAVISLSDSPLMFAIMFGLIAGMMVFISIKGLLPSSHRYDPEDKVTTWGFIIGMVIMAASLILFDY